MRKRKKCRQREEPSIPCDRISIAKHKLAELGVNPSLDRRAGKLGVEHIKEAFLEEMAAELHFEK